MLRTSLPAGGSSKRDPYFAPLVHIVIESASVSAVHPSFRTEHAILENSG
jgi:hypothetical protein